jgi:hypothetical protein
MMQHQERLEYQRLRRKDNENADTKKYEKTKKGKLMRTYRNMQSRTQGLVKSHLYANLPLLDRDAFYQWSLSSLEFNRLYDSWVQSGYDKKLSPSIDRVDSNKGYILSNIRWVTHSENSRLGGISRWKND